MAFDMQQPLLQVIETGFQAGKLTASLATKAIQIRSHGRKCAVAVGDLIAQVVQSVLNALEVFENNLVGQGTLHARRSTGRRTEA